MFGEIAKRNMGWIPSAIYLGLNMETSEMDLISEIDRNLLMELMHLVE